MKSVPEMPSDLDYQAKKKWEELITSVDPDADLEMLGNYCRQHSSLLAIRREKRKQQKSGKFRTMVKGRDGTMALHPLITAENRMVASLYRMLQALGLVSSREEVGVKRLPASQRHAEAMDAMESALCTFTMENALRHAFMERTGLPYLDSCDAKYTAEDQKRAEVILVEHNLRYPWPSGNRLM
jgi:phage terminase small subunit